MPAMAVMIGAMAFLAISVCAGTGSSPCPYGADHFVEYQIFMGRSNASGEVVDDAAWSEFLEDTVIPRFPEGLTVLDGQGHWRGAQGLVYQERSKLLIILAPPGDGPMRLTNEVSTEYKRKFGQESVLHAVSYTCVSFS